MVKVCNGVIFVWLLAKGICLSNFSNIHRSPGIGTDHVFKNWSSRLRQLVCVCVPVLWRRKLLLSAQGDCRLFSTCDKSLFVSSTALVRMPNTLTKNKGELYLPRTANRKHSPDSSILNFKDLNLVLMKTLGL